MKRRRCTSCGRFVGASHACLRDIDRELQSDEPLGILYKIPDISLSVSPVARCETLNCLSTLGLTDFLVSPDISIANDSKICTLRPARVTAILGDGNCLFSSLAVALGLTQDCRSIIRNTIVSNMIFINFPQNSLQTSIYSNDFPNQHRVLNCSSVEEYLRISKMSKSGIYGTCVEIYAFCQIFQVDVFLYHVSLKSWLVYECSSNMNRRGIFIQQTWNANHFEVINELVSITNERIVSPQKPCCLSSNARSFSMSNCGDEVDLFKHRQSKAEGPPTKKLKVNTYLCSSTIDLTMETPCSREKVPNVPSNKDLPMSVLPEKTTNQVICKDIQNFITVQSTPITLTENDATSKQTKDDSCRSAAGAFCDKCSRQSTLHYPFSLTRKKKSNLKNRMFGKKFRELFVNLCNLCLEYCTSDRIGWKHAWPSVFFTLLSDQKMFMERQLDVLTLLSLEIRQQWLGALDEFPSCVKQFLDKREINGKWAVDGTLRLHRFQTLMKTLEQENIALALDSEPYPNVRCPFGCWCFIEESGFIAVKHFLNFIDTEFTSFQASGHLHLRGIRSDFLVPTSSLRQFLVAATVRVDSEEGLVIHACSMHSKGLSLQYLHPPSHPVLSRIALIHERLSVVAPTISWITNIKANFANHMYQLLRSVGSYSGMSTVQLRRQTRWDITNDFLYHAEAVTCRFRDDIETLICQWVREGKIVEDVALGMLQYEPQMENVKNCLSHTSSTDLEACV